MEKVAGDGKMITVNLRGGTPPPTWACLPTSLKEGGGHDLV